MKNTSILPVLFLLFLLNACGKVWENCLRSTGNQTEETRLISEFKNLIIRDNINVTWHHSDSILIKIRAGKNLIPQIRTVVSDQNLILQNDNICNWTRSYDHKIDVHLYSPDPYLVKLEGFGVFQCQDTLKTHPLTLQHYGAGDMVLNIRVYELYIDFNSIGNCTVSGWAKSGSYYLQNAGKLKANQLEMKQCEMYMESENDAWIWVSEQISGVHHSTRTLFLKGRPNGEIFLKGKGGIVEIK